MYLFNNTPIQTRFDESDKKIASELNKITDNELLNCDLQKIADRIEQQYSIICDTEFTTEDVEPISYLMPISREALRPELRIGAIHEFYDFVAVDYKFKIQGDYTFFFNTPTDTHYAPIKGSANANGLTLTIITEYTRIPLSDEWKERVKEDIKFLVSEVKSRINLLKEECKKRNANIKPNVLSILEKERQNLIEKKAHDAKLNPFKYQMSSPERLDICFSHQADCPSRGLSPCLFPLRGTVFRRLFRPLPACSGSG